MYRVGELSERVTFRRYQQSQDEYGALVETTQDYATVWAHVRPSSGNEVEFADSVEARRMYLIVVRYRSDVAHDDVILWRGEPMNIRVIKDRGPRSEFLEIEAEAGVTI